MNTPILRLTARHFLALGLILALASGCSDSATTDGDVVSYSATTDGNVVSDTNAAGDGSADAGADTVEGQDDASGDVSEDTQDSASFFSSDLPIITEIDKDVDLSEYFPDAAVPDAAEPDITSPTDTDDSEVGPAPMDILVTDGLGSDTEPQGPDTFLSDCDTLGVAPSWLGSFEGAIEYHVPEALADLFYPTDGILIVAGVLGFDIECVDSKLIVSGDMDGAANVSGEGEFPFQVKLAGYFNPTTGYLNATMVEGKVVMYELAEIYFSGDFTGTLVDEVFDGQWTAHYDGSNFPLPPGDEPVADGLGTWTTTPVDSE